MLGVVFTPGSVTRGMISGDEGLHRFSQYAGKTKTSAIATQATSRPDTHSVRAGGHCQREVAVVSGRCDTSLGVRTIGSAVWPRLWSLPSTSTSAMNR